MRTLGRMLIWRYLLFLLLSSIFILPALAQNTSFTQEAVGQAKQGFTTQWLSYEGDWYLYYEIPDNPFTPVLGQHGPIRRYVVARDVKYSVDPRQLTQVDTLNGLEWSGKVAFYAAVAREYDVAKGWSPWVNSQTLVVYQLERRNGQWHMTQLTGLAVPPSTKFRRPTADELPSPNDGPRQAPAPPPPSPCKPWETPTPEGGCRQWRAPYSNERASHEPRTSPSPSSPCPLRCKRDDAFCPALSQRLIDMNLCQQDVSTSSLQCSPHNGFSVPELDLCPY